MDQFRAYLCFEFLVHGLAQQGTVAASSRLLADAIHRNYSPINEILTHVFDFLYFYGKNDKAYIRAVWASWAVIPNIHHRIPDYLLRCLCALAANNLRRGDRLSATIDRLKVLLDNLANDLPGAQYVRPAAEILRRDEVQFHALLLKCLPLVRFVRYVLYSQEVARPLTTDILAGPGDPPTYGMTALEFDESRVTSPLVFTEVFAADSEGQELRSAWILHKLALSVIP